MSLPSIFLRAPGAAFVATITLTLAACGGSSGADRAADATAQKPDTSIKQIARQPLTAADFAGLDSTQLVMELPWTENKVSRDPAPEAPRASLKSVATKGTEGFDRVLFGFDDSTPFPGYAVSRGQPGDTLVCGNDTTTLNLGGTAVLLVRLNPARPGDGKTTWVREGTKSLGLTRFQKGGLVCDDGHDVIWAASVADGKEVRVLEFRNPPRLAVDIR
ncbi:MAG: hypothetical protein LJF04_13290 [Gemmatimonadetes bacterium]|nr:hypothetical protein [Gemmatimonadota bacterium]